MDGAAALKEQEEAGQRQICAFYERTIAFRVHGRQRLKSRWKCAQKLTSICAGFRLVIKICRPGGKSWLFRDRSAHGECVDPKNQVVKEGTEKIALPKWANEFRCNNLPSEEDTRAPVRCTESSGKPWWPPALGTIALSADSGPGSDHSVLPTPRPRATSNPAALHSDMLKEQCHIWAPFPQFKSWAPEEKELSFRILEPVHKTTLFRRPQGEKGERRFHHNVAMAAMSLWQQSIVDEP
ncbi:hypothetical protein E5288_WYG006716 [Bos mutus]|uniref:Uncharacterized protein n=1 Tax=Bos mutus TaxID=72004 RepID=A0A6B0REX7_9CETA|nr:hypothetical protein [Bos mutus]